MKSDSSVLGFVGPVAAHTVVRRERSGGGVTTVDDRVRGGATSVTDRGAVKRSGLEELKRTTERRDAESSKVDQMLADSFPASDPPSWSGAISRVAVSAEQRRLDASLSASELNTWRCPDCA